MGIVKDVKAARADEHAARARAEGRTVFLYKLNMPATSSRFSEPVSGAAEVIEAVERQGWVLHQLAYDSRQGSNGSALLLFRPRQR